MSSVAALCSAVSVRFNVSDAVVEQQNDSLQINFGTPKSSVRLQHTLSIYILIQYVKEAVDYIEHQCDIYLKICWIHLGAVSHVDCTA